MVITSESRKSEFFADPTRDQNFKLICQHPILLISILNSLLDLTDKYDDDDADTGRACFDPVRKIVSIEGLPSTFINFGYNLYTPTCDFRCITEKGDIIIIEMQFARVPSFVQRMQYYCSRAIVDSVQAGTKE